MDNKSKRVTFDGRNLEYNELPHQHLSNIYWFNTVLHKREHLHDYDLMVNLENRFGGIILPYKPLVEFKEEIAALKELGHTWNNHIIHDNKVVGELP